MDRTTSQGKTKRRGSPANEAAQGEIHHARRGAAAGGAVRSQPDVRRRGGARRREGEIVHLRPWRLVAGECWVVYKNPKEIALKSSDVILVCKRTGRVLYEGSAGDEG